MKIKTFDDIDSVLFEIAKCDVQIKTNEAAMNEEIQKIKNAYDEKTRDTIAKKDELSLEVESFCNEHKGEFEKIRSKAFIHGSVGFTKSPPKVLQLSSRWKIAKTIDAIKAKLKGIYVRETLKKEIDKDSILRDYGRKSETGKVILDDKKLADVGLRIEQDDNFYIDLNFESLEN